MARYSFQGVCRDNTGAIIASAEVTVYEATTLTLATIYAARSGGSPLSGSIATADTNGYYKFYVEDTDYPMGSTFDLVIAKPGYVTTTYYDVR